MSDTVTWLRELGAVRPMATAAENVLVLGKCRDGFYPIEWRKVRTASGVCVERWFIFGIDRHYPLDQPDCERILKATGDL